MDSHPRRSGKSWIHHWNGIESKQGNNIKNTEYQQEWLHAFLKLFYAWVRSTSVSVLCLLKMLARWISELFSKQECIPVGCAPPACWPYPSMHWAGGCVSQHALGRGYLLEGVPAWVVWGCTCPEGWCTCLGVYLPGGVPAWGVYLPSWCLSQHAMGQTPPPPVDRQTPVKT